MRTYTPLLLLAGFLCQSCSGEKHVTFESLLNDMADRYESTRSPEPKYVAKAATSYDRVSVTNDPRDGHYVKKDGKDWGRGWFANRDFGHYLRLEKFHGRQEKVLLDDKGPGAIVRWWSPADNNGTIRVYLDGAPTPTIQGRPLELVGGEALASYPLSFRASDDSTKPSRRAHNLYLPIPYQRRCKITWEGKPGYYQINYRRYAPGTVVKTFTMDQLSRGASTLKRVSERLTAGRDSIAGIPVTKSDMVLAAGQSTSLIIDEPGAITKLAVRLAAKDYSQALRSTVVTMSFDGTRTGWIPIGALGGVGYSAENNHTYFKKVDHASGSIASYYVMPFEKTAKIMITNHGKQTVTLKKFRVFFDKDYRFTSRSFHFHATWFELRRISTEHRRDQNFVTILGEGRYVGTSITVFNTCTLKDNRTWWGDGDDKVYVDGEDFPSIFGTGTEDYFGYAYGRPQRFWTPFVSQPRGEGNKSSGYTNNNRHHLLDDIPFTKSLRFDMEIWHPFLKPMNYAAATFFYGRPGTTSNIAPNPGSAAHNVALNRETVLGTDQPTTD